MEKIGIKLFNFLEKQNSSAKDTIELSREELRELIELFMQITVVDIGELSGKERKEEVRKAENILNSKFKDFIGEIDPYDFLFALKNL